MIDTSYLATLGEAERFILFVFVFTYSRHAVASLRRYLIECLQRKIRKETVEYACERLERAGILKCDIRYRSSDYTEYSFSGGFDREALQLLLKESIERDWWKLCEVNSNTGAPYAKHSGYLVGGGMNLAGEQDQAVRVRALIGGEKLYADLSACYDPGDKYWRAASAFAKRLSGKCVWDFPSVDFDPKRNPIGLHLRLLATLFVAGRDVRKMVSTLGAAVESGKLVLNDISVCELAALGALTGTELNLAIAQKWEVVPAAKEFAGIAAVLRAGDLARANKLCIAAFKEIGGLHDLVAPAFNVLALLVSALDKPSSSRLNQHLRALVPSTTYRYNDRGYGERRVVDDRGRELSRLAAVLSLERFDADRIIASHFLDNLSEPLWMQVYGLKKSETQEKASDIFATAAEAQKHGYPTIAGAYLSTFGWALPDSRKAEASALAARITEEGGIWLKPFCGESSEWTRLLAALDERLPKSAAKKAVAAKVKTGRLVWSLALDPTDYGELSLVAGDLAKICLGCLRMAVAYRGARAAEDGSEDKSVTFKSVYGGKFDECLTEADKTAVAALNKAGYTGKHDIVRVPAAAVEALCGADNVRIGVVDLETKECECVPATLVRQDVPVVGKGGKEGEAVLSVPEWCLRRTEQYVVRKTGENAYAFYPLSKEVRSILEVFRDFGDRGAVRLPAAAMEKARPVFGRLAAVLPLQGSLAGMAGRDGGEGLRRVKGDATPLLRLALEEMRLHVSLRVRPLAEAPTVFEPGKGQGERTIRLAKGPVILVRDLAAEQKAAEKVSEALSDLESYRESPCEWQIDEAVPALTALAAVHALGEAVKVEWQPGKRLSVVRPSAHPAVEASAGMDHWLSVSGEWTLDDGRVISFAKLLEQFGNRVGAFVPIDEKGYLQLSRTLLRQLEALSAAGQVRKGALEISPAAMPMLEGALSEEAADGMSLPKAIGEEAERIRAAFAHTAAVPRDFKGTMRPYQEEGYVWLSRLCESGIGACLADDMGLGKTIQIIALLVAEREKGPSLVVAPASVAFNWRNELSRFAPSLRCALVGQTPGAGEEDVAALAKASDVVITSYGVEASRVEAFAAVGWNVVVLDEAQAIKNHLTQRAKCAKELKARFRIAATGTPIENRLSELWSIFDFINPGMLGGETRFAKELAPHGEATPRLKRLVKPLILRRIKREVLTDLPEKEEITVPVVLSDAERHAYEAARVTALEKLKNEDPTNKIAILAELTRLRRFCCHPSLVYPELGESSKLETLERLLTDLRENGHRALVFSQFVDYLAIVQRLLKRNGWSYEYLDGSTPKAQREASVERFQAGAGDFFLISLKAGGMGLNLTAANYVILLDPWWNPAVENQAADRVHRIGQRLPVTVYRLIAQDTIEEKVVELHAKKTALAEDILATGASALSAESMLGLLEG